MIKTVAASKFARCSCQQCTCAAVITCKQDAMQRLVRTLGMPIHSDGVLRLPPVVKSVLICAFYGCTSVSLSFMNKVRSKLGS